MDAVYVCRLWDTSVALLPFHTAPPLMERGWFPLSQGTLCFFYVLLATSGGGLIFRDSKAGGRLGWGSGRVFLGSSMLSTTTKKVDSVSNLP